MTKGYLRDTRGTLHVPESAVSGQLKSGLRIALECLELEILAFKVGTAFQRCLLFPCLLSRLLNLHLLGSAGPF